VGCSIYIAQFGGSLTSQTSINTSLSIFFSRYQFKIASLAKPKKGGPKDTQESLVQSFPPSLVLSLNHLIPLSSSSSPQSSC
jgi:hypothetical protein